MNTKKILASLISVMGVFVFAVTAYAATTVVTPTNTQGWSTADTRTGGQVNYAADATSPYPSGALQLLTNETNEAKAQYMHAADGALTDVTELSYYNKTTSGPVHAAASYQLAVDLNGAATGGFTTLVYEPYWNGTVTQGVWEQWDVDAGEMWSSRSFSEGTCTVVAGAGGPPLYTLSTLQTLCPDATVLGFGVNVGTYNPGYDVSVDGVNFNGTAYDFELDPVLVGPPTDKNECKNGGWMTFDNPTFKNQGACVSYVQSNEAAGKRN